MADIQLQLVLVTPEKTLLDEPVAALRFPLFDGQIGILPGRAPAIGRLGYGELRITTAEQGMRSYFIDGGFVQVRSDTVSILTNRAIRISDIDREAAETQLQRALRMVAATPADMEARAREQQRARRLLALARHTR